MLMRGFTTARDAGGASIGIQRAIDDGWFAGPRIFSLLKLAKNINSRSL